MASCPWMNWDASCAGVPEAWVIAVLAHLSHHSSFSTVATMATLPKKFHQSCK